MDALRAELARVAADKAAAEADVEAASSRLRASGVGMSEPLIDADGFPRSDVDVHAARADRHTAIVRMNDVKAATKRADELLQQLHAAARQAGVVSGGAPRAPATTANRAPPPRAPAGAPASTTQVNVPFAIVRDVAPGSPSADAGLAVGDRVVSFGSVAARGADGAAAALAAVPAALEAAVVASSTLDVTVLRAGAPVTVTLAPRQGWGGRGALGCHLVPP